MLGYISNLFFTLTFVFQYIYKYIYHILLLYFHIFLVTIYFPYLNFQISTITLFYIFGGGYHSCTHSKTLIKLMSGRSWVNIIPKYIFAYYYFGYVFVFLWVYVSVST